MPTIVTMPKWGLTMTTGTITSWIASEGDEVAEGAPLLTVETEKAVNDVEAPAEGVLVKIVAGTGDEIPVMGALAVIAAKGEVVSDDEIAALVGGAAPVAAAGAVAAASGPARAPRAAARDASGRVNASPAARKRAAELGIDLATVEATGPGGRVTSEDIDRAAAAAKNAAAAPREDIVTLASGRQIASLVAGPEDAETKLLFIHGLTGSQATWGAVLGPLVDRYRLAAIDLPGHGKSDKPMPEAADYSAAGLAENVGEVIVSLGLAPAVVVGHSFGGAVALSLAQQRPKLVRALVLVDSGGLGPEISPELISLVEAHPSKDVARGLLELFIEDKRLVLDRGVDDMYHGISQAGAHGAIRAIVNDAFPEGRQNLSLAEKLGDVHTPTFLVWGELDRVIPVAQSGAAHDKIAGSWLEVIEGIGHVPQVEAPQRFAELLEEFVTSLPPVPEPEPEPAPNAEAETDATAAEPAADAPADADATASPNGASDEEPPSPSESELTSNQG